MHDWFAQGSATEHGHRSHLDIPWWKCDRCGTRVQSWNKPPPQMQVTTKSGQVSCEEYMVTKIMES